MSWPKTFFDLCPHYQNLSDKLRKSLCPSISRRCSMKHKAVTIITITITMIMVPMVMLMIIQTVTWMHMGLVMGGRVDPFPTNIHKWTLPGMSFPQIPGCCFSGIILCHSLPSSLCQNHSERDCCFEALKLLTYQWMFVKTSLSIKLGSLLISLHLQVTSSLLFSVLRKFVTKLFGCNETLVDSSLSGFYYFWKCDTHDFGMIMIIYLYLFAWTMFGSGKIERKCEGKKI